MGADRRGNTVGRFEPRAAYLSDCSVELPLRPSARAAPPLGPRSLARRLRARTGGGWCWVVSTGIDTKAERLGGGAL